MNWIKNFFSKESLRDGVSDFSFIENPTVIPIIIRLETVEGVFEQESLNSQAEIIWKFNDMKAEVMKVKGFSSADMINSVAQGLNYESNSTSTIIDSNRVFLKTENVGADNEYCIAPSISSHVDIEVSEEEFEEAVREDEDEEEDEEEGPIDWEYLGNTYGSI